MSTSASAVQARTPASGSLAAAFHSIVSVLFAIHLREAFDASTKTDPADAKWTWGM